MRIPAIRRAAWLPVALAMLGGMSAAQSDIGGSVGGRVLGPDGRAVPGVLVRAENGESGEHIDRFSDRAGSFQFVELPPGMYRLRAHAEGLSDWEADHLLVGIGTTLSLHVQLVPLSEHRTVLIDARLSSVGSPVSDAREQTTPTLAEDLPNNTQHWSTLAALFSASTASDDGGLSFRGLSPQMNSIAVDGTDGKLAFRARERGTAGNGFATAQSAVGEFQVTPTAVSAENGRAAGGVLTAVTRSGSNHMHGQGVFYDRGAIGQALNAYTKVMQPEPAGTMSTSGQPVFLLNGQPISYVAVPYHAPDRRQQWEVSAGGPIRRDRLFWFFAWEQHDRNDPAVARANEPEVFFAPPSQATLATLEARLARSANATPLLKNCPGAGLAASGSTAQAACAWSTVVGQLNGMLGDVPRSTRQTNVFPKISWRINPGNNLVFQYNSMRRTAPHGAFTGASETEGIGSFGDSSTSDDVAVVRWEYFATPKLLSSARLQVSRDVLAQRPATPTAFEQMFAGNAWGLPPQISIDRSAGFSFGTPSTVNKREYPAETRQQLMDAITWIHQRHALRFGYDYNHVIDVLDGLSGENGHYTYGSLLDFLSDLLAPNSCDGTTTGTGPYPCYMRYRQSVGATHWSFGTEDYATYIADQWKPGRGLSFTMGVRYEYQRLPNPNAALVNADIPQTAALPHDRTGFGPRAGFAWDILGAGRTVLRGGYGLYIGRVPNATVFSALTATGSARSPRTYSWRPMDVGAPPFPYVFASDETPYVDPRAPNQSSTAPDVVYFDPRFRHPQIHQLELSLEQSLGPRTLLTFTGMATDGRDLTQFVDTNIDRTAVATIFYSIQAPGNMGYLGPLAKAATPVSGYTNVVYAPQRFYYQRLQPSYGAITDILGESNSSYRGAMLRVVHRLSRSLTLNVGYTWAHAMDDNQSEATFANRNDVYDPADLRLDHGTSNYDVRQRIAGGLVLRTPWRFHGGKETLLGGYSLAAAGEWHMGLPYSMRTLGSLPTPSCSYQNWLNAGGATGHGANCLQAVHEPDDTFTATTAGQHVPIPALGATLNGSGGEDLLLPIGRNTFRYPAAANLDLRFTKKFRLSDRFSFSLLGEAFNAFNHRNVTSIQTIGYRLGNDTTHPNMATLSWQSGMKPGTKTTLVNGSTQTQYTFDPTAAFGGVTNANSNALIRERQLQIGAKLTF